MTRHATDRLLTAVIVGAGGLVLALLTGEPEVAVLVAPWVILLIVGLAGSQSGNLDIEVDVPVERLLIGDELELTVTLRGMRGSAMVAAKPGDTFWRPGAKAHVIGATLLHEIVGPDGTMVSLPLEATQWGVHHVGEVEVTLTEPYGLLRWSGGATEPRYVRVHPRPAEVKSLLAPWLVRRVTGAHSSNLLGRGVEYADVRHFTSGDSLREINWRATARSTDLLVSSRHPDRGTDVVLILDSFVEAGHDVRAVFGLAIEGAVALAESHISVSDRVGLVQLGGAVHWIAPGAGRHHLARIVDDLLSTGFRRHAGERNLALLLSRALPPRSFVVALTPLFDDRFVEALFILASHGHDVAVIECVTTATEIGSSDRTLRLAHRMWEAERQMMRDRLGENGVAIAEWRGGDHLDLTLVDLTRRRRLAVRGRR